MMRSVQELAGVCTLAAAVLLSACGAVDGEGRDVAAPGAPSVAESRSASSSPAEVDPLSEEAKADPLREEAVAAVREWYWAGGTGTADHYDAERAPDAPSAADINARYGWGAILGEARGGSHQCMKEFPPPDGCEFPLGEVWVQERADHGLPVVEPDLYAEQVTILGQARAHAGERVSMVVYIPRRSSNGCPDEFTGLILLGLDALYRDDGNAVGESGWDFEYYDKSQPVRFVVNGSVDGMCRLRGESVGLEASVLGESSPTFSVESVWGSYIHGPDELNY